MEAIYDPNEKFDFEKILLTPPSSVSGGNHFSKFIINDNSLYIQTPKCRIKHGMIKTAKKVYCDLMFTIENESFIQWIENLENYCKTYIFTKRDIWFESNLEKDDIENSFTSSLKLFKSGKFYTLRIHLPTVLGKPNIKVYDENENNVDIESIEEDRNIISIIEIQGIKCSVRGFQIEMELKQLLLLKKENLFDKCILIKKSLNQTTTGMSNTAQPLRSSSAESNDNVNKQDGNYDNTQLPEDLDPNYLALVPETASQSCMGSSTFGIHNETNLDFNSATQRVLLHHSVNALKSPNRLGSMNVSPDVEGELLENNAITGPVLTETLDVDVVKLNDKILEDNKLKPFPEDNNIEILKEKEDNHELFEVEFDLDKMSIENAVTIKKRNDVFYEMYKEAMKKAKFAKDLALSSYLEAKRIKNTHMLEEISDESDFDEESLNFSDE